MPFVGGFPVERSSRSVFLVLYFGLRSSRVPGASIRRIMSGVKKVGGRPSEENRSVEGTLYLC